MSSAAEGAGGSGRTRPLGPVSRDQGARLVIVSRSRRANEAPDHQADESFGTVKMSAKAAKNHSASTLRCTTL